MPVNASQTHFNDPEAQVASVEHDDLILIGAVVHDVPQGEQRGRVGQHCAPPRGVPFMSYHEVFFMRHNGFIEHSRVIILIWRSEMILYTEIKNLSFLGNKENDFQDDKKFYNY